MRLRVLVQNGLAVVLCLAAVLSSSWLSKAQTESVSKRVDIAVRVLDGRNGRPIPNQRVLVFVGASSEAAKSHAEHTDLTTDKDGVGTLTVYPNQTQWIQVWVDGRALCYPDPNQSSFRVDTIMSTGIVTWNKCGGVLKEPVPGHLIIFARPAGFIEKMRR